MGDDFSGRVGAVGDGNIDVGVENIDLKFEKIVIDNAPGNKDVDETKVPRGK